MAAKRVNSADMVGAKRLAWLFGVSTTRVHQMIREGILPRSVDGKRYDEAAAVQSLVRHLRSQLRLAQRGGANLATERTRLTKTKADIAEAQRQVTLGNLVPADQVGLVWQEIVVTARTRLLAIPDKVAARIAAVRSPREAAALVRAELYEALSELANPKAAGAIPANADCARAATAGGRA
jgi:phage terminase Nu1 subunit (DNA packaging protein)